MTKKLTMAVVLIALAGGLFSTALFTAASGSSGSGRSGSGSLATAVAPATTTLLAGAPAAVTPAPAPVVAPVVQAPPVVVVAPVVQAPPPPAVGVAPAVPSPPPTVIAPPPAVATAPAVQVSAQPASATSCANIATFKPTVGYVRSSNGQVGAVWVDFTVQNCGPATAMTATLSIKNMNTGQVEWEMPSTEMVQPGGSISRKFDHDGAKLSTPYGVTLIVRDASTGNVLSSRSTIVNTPAQKPSP